MQLITSQSECSVLSAWAIELPILPLAMAVVASQRRLTFRRVAYCLGEEHALVGAQSEFLGGVPSVAIVKMGG